MTIRSILVVVLFSLGLGACAGWDPDKPRDQRTEQLKVDETKARFLERDPGLQRFFSNAAGYAIFPTVGKGGVGVGGAYGRGRVYQGGRYIGDTSLTQLTVGFQWGGQAYSEVIFFQNQRALDEFREGNFEFGAQASAVAANLGASVDAAYEQGVAVFTIAKGGLMYEASVGGQKFKFYPN